jgi:hypothetical protein
MDGILMETMTHVAPIATEKPLQYPGSNQQLGNRIMVTSKSHGRKSN